MQKSEVRNIIDLFNSNSKVFVIPDYQRAYSWDKKNWDDFWEDIKDGILTKTEHYWGTVTLRKNSDDSTLMDERERVYNQYEIVDGQQRITTIYIFLLALSKCGKKIVVDEYLKCGDIYRLEMGEVNNGFMRALIDDKTIETDNRSNKRIIGALQHFQNILKSLESSEDKKIGINDVSKYLLNNTSCLEFIIEDESLAIKIFESLNDRGKPLALLDKIKSYLMYCSHRYLNDRLNAKIRINFGKVFNKFDKIKETGEKCNINYLTRKEFKEDELLRFFYHYFADYAVNKYGLVSAYDYDFTAEDVFDEFIKNSVEILRTDEPRLEEFLNEFVTDFDTFVSTFYELIESTNTNKKIKQMLRFLGINSILYPLMISLKMNNLLDDDALNLIEVLDIRLYKFGNQPRAGVYRKVISQIKSEPDRVIIAARIKEIISYFMDDTKFAVELSGDVYENLATKYILWQYEKEKYPNFDDADSEAYEDATKDHIFAQNDTLTLPAFGFTDDMDFYYNKNKIGNLALLEEDINKREQEINPIKKAEAYQLSRYPRTKKLGYDKDFSKSMIEKITGDVVEFCKKHWAIA